MTDREVIMQQALTALVAMQMEAAHRNCGLKIANDSIIALRAAIAQEPEWVDDPHDIEQGMMRNPKWKPATNIAQPEQTTELPVNHAEAQSLAYIKRQESNLARCYLDLCETAQPEQAANDEKDAEIARLTACLKAANADTEKFEREWYLRGDELEAIRAQPEQPPVCYQFQTKDKKWHSFSNEAHYKNTVVGGRWPIRALCISPQVAQPEQPAGDWISEKGVRLLMRTEYDRGYRQCKYDSMDAIAQPEQTAINPTGGMT